MRDGAAHAPGMFDIAREAADAVALPVELGDHGQRFDQQVVALARGQAGDAQQARWAVIGRRERTRLHARLDHLDADVGKPHPGDAVRAELAGGDHAAHRAQGFTLERFDAQLLRWGEPAFVGQGVMHEREQAQPPGVRHDHFGQTTQGQAVDDDEAVLRQRRQSGLHRLPCLRIDGGEVASQPLDRELPAQAAQLGDDVGVVEITARALAGVAGDDEVQLGMRNQSAHSAPS